VSDAAIAISVVALLLSAIAITVSLAAPSGRSSGGPSEFRLAQLERRVDALAAHTGAPPEAAPDWMGDVQDLVDDGKKIEAIKLYRRMTGAGLAESKDAVEEMASRRPGA